MNGETRKSRTNGVAVAASVVAAGIVGTLASALFGRSESKREVAQRRVTERLEQLEASAGQTVDNLVKAVERLEVPLPRASKRAQRKARAAGKSASKVADSALKSTKLRIAEIDRETRKLQAIEKANKLGHDGSRRASELARQLSSRTSDLLDDNRAGIDEWRSKASRSAGDILDRGSTLAHHARDAAPEIRDRASKSASDAKARGSKAAQRAKDQAPGVIDRATHLLRDATEHGSAYASQAREKGPELRGKASKTAHEVAEHVREISPEVREKATELTHSAADRASTLVDQAKEKGPEVLGVVGMHLTDALHSAQKQARPLVEEAASAATRVVEQAKDAAESVLPEFHHRSDSVSERLQSQGQAAVSTLSNLGTTATSALAHTTDTIEHKSKSAATAAGRGTKDAGALVAWTAVAAGLAFVAFLDDQQRQKVKESGRRIAAEIKEVVRDIRGQDEEFTRR